MGDLISGRFHEIIDDATTTPERVRRVLLCSGKVYHEIVKLRTKTETDDVAVVRVEQFYPFPEEQVRRAWDATAKRKNTSGCRRSRKTWAAGCSSNLACGELGYTMEYVGRDASASPATGSHEVHKREQAELVEAAISGEAPHLVRALNPVRPRLRESVSTNGSHRDEIAVAPSTK